MTILVASTWRCDHPQITENIWVHRGHEMCRLCRGWGPLIPGHKRCSKCRVWLPTADFPRCRKNVDGLHGYCRSCNAVAVREVARRRAAKDPAWAQAERERKRDALRALRLEVVAAYGGKCECCGEDHVEFLAIDHINGGGRAHRKSLGSRFYIWLKRNGYPRDEFRLLCHNCNTARGLYGSCPHESETMA